MPKLSTAAAPHLMEYPYCNITYHSLDNLSKDDVLVVEPTGLGEEDVKLGAIGVWSMVGHGNPSS